MSWTNCRRTTFCTSPGSSCAAPEKGAAYHTAEAMLANPATAAAATSGPDAAPRRRVGCGRDTRPRRVNRMPHLSAANTRQRRTPPLAADARDRRAGDAVPREPLYPPIGGMSRRATLGRTEPSAGRSTAAEHVRIVAGGSGGQNGTHGARSVAICPTTAAKRPGGRRRRAVRAVAQGRSRPGGCVARAGPGALPAARSATWPPVPRAGRHARSRLLAGTDRSGAIALAIQSTGRGLTAS